jgi:transcriptional regulator GlxA family with amidase domain
MFLTWGDTVVARSSRSVPRATRIAVLLIPDFALIAYASALEPFRAANRISGRELYTWRHVSPDGAPVRASNGIHIVGDDSVGDLIDADLLLVCAGGNPANYKDAKTFRWLRRCARQRIKIVGVSGGSYLLARAGLLDNYRFTIHWEHVPALTEEFPHLDVTGRLYEIDRDRLSCSGGTAALDLMSRLIAIEHGEDLANDVNDWFIHTNVRPGDGPQRAPVRERNAIASPRLVHALETMEANIEQPLSVLELARRAGVTSRQLERLARQYLDRSIAAHYLELRLRRARLLLLQSPLPILEVAIATGFVSSSHFARAFKKRFGFSPRVQRQARRLR